MTVATATATATTMFRIETEDGKGTCPVAGNSLCVLYRRAGGEEREVSNWPTGKAERKACYVTCKLHWQYAFPNLNALKEWFPSALGRKAMQDAGAKLVEYENRSDHTFSNGHQVAFDKLTAKKVGAFDLVTLERLP